MSDIKWRFPGNGYTADSGLDTADMETFKKDAIASLARELCQNSIDAKNPEVNGPVKLEFKSFYIDSDMIPGRNELVEEIHDCQETWKTHKKISKQLSEMNKEINKSQICCLRISDFNTTGLVGVSGGDKTPWHYLVHGSGISDKGDTSGGSKGIGKYATFVTSHFNTVFYSTLTKNGEYGYEGICKLCSAAKKGTDEKTQGIGYFGSTIQNKPIEEELRLDSDFIRQKGQYGSDIYILGFKNPNGWKKDIISKILDSFMSAIVFKTLEVVVDGTIIKFDTLKDIVYSEEFINKNIRKSIISQYLLLTDVEHRFEDTIEIDGYGSAKLYLLEFDDTDDLATNNCVMIRYPFMKIKDLSRISTLPCSAMCIIGDNILNKLLRNIENPQHTDWEFKRIEDESEKTELKNVYKELVEKIKNCIIDHLSSSNNTRTDIEGAGEYLPGIDVDFEEGKGSKIKEIKDKASINKNKIKQKTTNVNASIEDEKGDGVELDIGSSSEDGLESLSPEGHNNSKGADSHIGENSSNSQLNDDGNIIFKKSDLRGMSYRFICLNKKECRYAVTFISDFSEDDAYFELYALDEGGNKYPVKLFDCKLNGEHIDTIDNLYIKLKLEYGKRVKIEMITDQKELFSGEVKVYAYR